MVSIRFLAASYLLGQALSQQICNGLLLNPVLSTVIYCSASPSPAATTPALSALIKKEKRTAAVSTTTTTASVSSLQTRRVTFRSTTNVPRTTTSTVTVTATSTTTVTVTPTISSTTTAPSVPTTTSTSTTIPTTTTSTTSSATCTATGTYVLQGSGTGDSAVDGNFAQLQSAFGSGYRVSFNANRRNAQQFQLGGADCTTLFTSGRSLQAMVGATANLHYVYFFPSIQAASALVNVNWEDLVCVINADNTLSCTAMGQSIFQVTHGDPLLQLGDQNYGEQVTINLVPVPGTVFK